MKKAIDGLAQGLVQGDMTRREFNAGVAGIAVLSGVGAEISEAQTRVDGASVPCSLNINGQQHQVPIEPRVTLLDLLRERLLLTGTKKGCDHGQCGACTVLVNGVR